MGDHNCDNCKHYKWYYDYCEKWKCEVDDREVHSCFEGRGEADGQSSEAIEALGMAVAALEGKDIDVPTSSALDHIHNVVRDDAYKRGYEQGKKDVPDTNVGEWIPVYEHLPDEEGHYLVTDEAAGIAEVLIDEYIRCDDGKWVWLYSQNAIAWMPLPKPWEGE